MVVFMAEETVLVKFLKKTKKGDYAPIQEASLPYARMVKSTYFAQEEECYHYSIS